MYDYAVKQGYTPKLTTVDEMEHRFGWSSISMFTKPAFYLPSDRQIFINPICESWKHPGKMVRENRAAGWLAFDKPTGLMDHEIGHAKHHAAIGDMGWAKLKLRHFTPETQAAITQDVSGYAATEPIEFVAEVYAGIKLGRTFSQRTMDLFSELNGVLPQ